MRIEHGFGHHCADVPVQVCARNFTQPRLITIVSKVEIRIGAAAHQLRFPEEEDGFGHEFS